MPACGEHSERGFGGQLGGQLCQVETYINNFSRHFHYNNMGLKLFVCTNFEHVNISCKIRILVIDSVSCSNSLSLTMDLSLVAHLHNKRRGEPIPGPGLWQKFDIAVILFICQPLDTFHSFS